jgi:hypothetical protein
VNLECILALLEKSTNQNAIVNRKTKTKTKTSPEHDEMFKKNYKHIKGRREADTQLAGKAVTQVSTDSILVLISCCKPTSISTAQSRKKNSNMQESCVSLYSPKIGVRTLTTPHTHLQHNQKQTYILLALRDRSSLIV